MRGAPAGNAADMPPPQKFEPEDDWHIGKPDLIVTMDKTHTMYPKGPDWWIDYFADIEPDRGPLDQGDGGPPGQPRRSSITPWSTSIEPDAPAGTPETGRQAARVRGRQVRRQLRRQHRPAAEGRHAHPFRHALLRHRRRADRPDRRWRSSSIRKATCRSTRCARSRSATSPNDELEIPPKSVVRHDGYLRLPRAGADRRLPAAHAHARQGDDARGDQSRTTPSTVLSSVDHFDFNWHVSYIYADDVAPLLPAGTVLHMIGIHDNTAANRRNPDPNMWAGFGERSVDDMLQVWMQRRLSRRCRVQAAGRGAKAKRRGDDAPTAAAAARCEDGRAVRRRRRS